MQTKLILAAISSALLSGTLISGPALAADPVVNPPVDYVSPAFNWSGFYVGIHAGGAWGRQHDTHSILICDASEPSCPHPGAFFLPVGAGVFDLDGFIGGVHVGHNWQKDSVVYGIEGDFDFTNIKGGTDFDYSGLTGHHSLKSGWQASLRARAGYAVDTWLFYATGGVAFAHAKFSLAYTWGETTVSDKNTYVGWTVGAGIEKAFTPNLIGRLEARYTDFGKKTFDPFNNGGTAISSDWHQASVTVGLSYKF